MHKDIKEPREFGFFQNESTASDNEKTRHQDEGLFSLVQNSSTLIDNSKLNPSHYTETLLTEAQKAGLVTDADIARFRMNCLSLLSVQIAAFTGGERSSVPNAVAENILSSLLYTFGLVLKDEPTPEKAAKRLTTEPLLSVYDEGQAAITRQIYATKRLYLLMLQRLFQTKNRVFRETATGGILGFFRIYRPAYAAHETLISMDYPLCLPVKGLTGIEAVSEYVRRLACENWLCAAFPPKAVDRLLTAYDRSYKDLVFNLLEPILTTALCCILCGHTAAPLHLTADNCQSLSRLFAEKTDEETQALLCEAWEVLCTKPPLAEKTKIPHRVSDYVKRCLPILSAGILGALRRGQPETVFLCVDEVREETPPAVLSLGKKMEDREFRKVAEKFSQAETLAERLAVIRAGISSPADFEDLLLTCDTLTEAEMLPLLWEAGKATVTVFTAKYNPEEDDRPEESDAEKRFCSALRAYLAALPPAEAKTLRADAAHLRKNTTII